MPLFWQGVRVDRLTEVIDVGYVLGFFRRRREADVGRLGEVIKDFAPGRVLGGTATMTLV